MHYGRCCCFSCVFSLHLNLRNTAICELEVSKLPNASSWHFPFESLPRQTSLSYFNFGNSLPLLLCQYNTRLYMNPKRKFNFNDVKLKHRENIFWSCILTLDEKLTFCFRQYALLYKPVETCTELRSIRCTLEWSQLSQTLYRYFVFEFCKFYESLFPIRNESIHKF